MKCSLFQDRFILAHRISRSVVAAPLFHAPPRPQDDPGVIFISSGCPTRAVVILFYSGFSPPLVPVRGIDVVPKINGPTTGRTFLKPARFHSWPPALDPDTPSTERNTRCRVVVRRSSSPTSCIVLFARRCRGALRARVPALSLNPSLSPSPSFSLSGPLKPP